MRICARVKSYISPKMTLLGVILGLSVPLLSSAQPSSSNGTTIGTYLTLSIGFINDFLIPLFIGIALLAFLWGMYKLFFFDGESDESRAAGRRLALWAVIGFVIIMSIWGIVNMLTYSLNIEETDPPCPDYNKNCNQSGTGTTGGSSAGGGTGGYNDPYAGINFPGNTSGGGTGGGGGSTNNSTGGNTGSNSNSNSSGTQNPNCRVLMPPQCDNGTLTSLGTDQNGCDIGYQCISSSGGGGAQSTSSIMCPQVMPPLCTDGNLVSLGTDSRGCSRGYQCATSDANNPSTETPYVPEQTGGEGGS